MKYIDAQRLRKEIKRLEKAAHRSALVCADSETRKFHEGKDFAYQHVGVLIDSLPQEQEELPKIAEYYYHKGVYEGLSQGRADGLKILEESMKIKADPVIVIKQQEQQEVDLGADIEMEWDSFNKHLAEYGKESDEVVWLNWLSFVDIARHFYELGKNSK